MRAFFIHDAHKEQDLMVLPDQDRLVAVNRSVMNEFISVHPDFSKCSGSALNGLAPESFGRIVATREEQGDVCIVETNLWQQRMMFHLGTPD